MDSIESEVISMKKTEKGDYRLYLIEDNSMEFYEYKDTLSKIITVMKRIVNDEIQEDFANPEEAFDKFLILAEYKDGTRDTIIAEYEDGVCTLSSLFDHEELEFDIEILETKAELFKIFDKNNKCVGTYVTETEILEDLSKMIIKEVIKGKELGYYDACDSFEIESNKGTWLKAYCEPQELFVDKYPTLFLENHKTKKVIEKRYMENDIKQYIKISKLTADFEGKIIKVYPVDDDGFIIPKSNQYYCDEESEIYFSKDSDCKCNIVEIIGKDCLDIIKEVD